MLLYIIRHGDPDYSTDTLTERGWQQAEAVGKRIAAAKIDRIFTSPWAERGRRPSRPADCWVWSRQWSLGAMRLAMNV